jgi:hypothetical protein
MLKDAQPVYFIIDALDKCDHGFDRIIELISGSLSLSTKISWLVSSRRQVDLLTRLNDLHKNDPNMAQVLLELDIQSQKDHVENYIQHKLSTLQSSKEVGKS